MKPFHFSTPASPSFPLLRYLGRSLPQTLGCPAPLEGLEVAAVLHLYPDLVAFTDALADLGLKPAAATFFYKPPEGYPYPHRREVIQALRKRGSSVRPLAELDLASLHCHPKLPLLLIEDGGLIYPGVHAAGFKARGQIVGAVEQTTRGRTNLERALRRPGRRQASLDRLRFPILSVPDCRLKSSIEPPLIARMVVINLQALTGLLNPGVKVAVLGGGAIGLGVIEELRKAGARVVAYDPRPETRLTLAERGVNLASSAVEAVRGATFVIGSSGAKSVTPDLIANLEHNAFVASTSSMNYEIDLPYLEALASERHVLPVLTGVPAGTEDWAGTTYRLPGRGGLRDVHVLADGYPLNFHGFQGLPDPHADLVMSLVLLGAAALGARNHTHRRRERYAPAWNRTAIDTLVKEAGLIEEFLRLYHPHAVVQ